LITANFLHGGWLHLIGNMWFLWLAGAVLEDTWGRLIYPAFYMIAGVLALQVHAMVNVGSMTPTIGASGAIAGLMGAFLVRFPTTKIEMGYLLFYRFYRFKMAAYWLLPVWLLMEILYGTSGASTGVAHWAHIGAVQNHHAFEQGDLQDAKGARKGQPDVLPELPVAFGEVLLAKALALFEDEDFVALFGETHGAHGAAEAGADDEIVVNKVDPWFNSHMETSSFKE
jgi:hypothetical protein